MQQVQSIRQITSPTAQDGVFVPALTHHEALLMSAEELRRFVTLIESLADGDWNKQTACSLWTVKDVVAHQATHVCGFTSPRNLISQVNPALLWPYMRKGMGVLDAMNQAQVDLRRHYTPSELIAEIHDAVDRSLKGRDRIPAFVRAPI